MSFVGSSQRSTMGTRLQGKLHVVPITDWTSTAYQGVVTFTHRQWQRQQFALLPSQHAAQRAKTARKPLRSSPLAGPALSNDRSVVSLADSDPAPRPSSSASMRNISEMLPTQPLSCHLRSKSSQSVTRPNSRKSIYPPSPSPSPQPHLSPQHSSSGSNVTPARSSRRLVKVRKIERPPSVVHPPRETTVHMEGVSAPSLPDLLDPSAAIRLEYCFCGTIFLHASERKYGSHGPGETQSILKPTAPVDNSWYVHSPYDITPKFSRLSLAAPNVVMPVSAKQHRKQLSRATSVRSTNNTSSGSATPESSRRSSVSPTVGSLGRNRTITIPGSIKVTRSPTNDGIDNDSENTTTTTTIDKDSTDDANYNHQPNWLSVPPQCEISPSRKGSLTSLRKVSTASSTSPTRSSSAASSAASLPLSSQSSSVRSSYYSACTSFTDAAAVTDVNDGNALDSELSGASVIKCKSVLARVKTWRRTMSPPLPSSHNSQGDGVTATDAGTDLQAKGSTLSLRAANTPCLCGRGRKSTAARLRSSVSVSCPHFQILFGASDSGTEEKWVGEKDVGRLGAR
ncbi:hypothetical protein BDZ97DRAFT_1919746 [Flammula alnicola]|nr:hypothetical protein BDZ97DRAFT_1919746 [Flammula alnicola]